MGTLFTAPNTEKQPKLIAHRGFTPVAPQNSLPAFRAAGERGFWAIETDVHKTRDGVLVCNHNPNVDEMYDGSGLIAAMSLDELRCFALNKGKSLEHYTREELRIPLFSEYLEICREYHAVPFIETKTPDISDVIEVACRYFPEEKIVISSLQFEHIERAREISSKVFIHYIFGDTASMCRISELGYGGLSYNYHDLSEVPDPLIAQTHAAGVRLCLRAGDSIEAVQNMLSMGLDYMPTNCISPNMLI